MPYGGRCSSLGPSVLLECCGEGYIWSIPYGSLNYRFLVSSHRGLQSAVTWLLWTNHLCSPHRTLSCSTCRLNAGSLLHWRDPSSCPEGNGWMLLHILRFFLMVWYIYAHTHLTLMKKTFKITHAGTKCGDRPEREERELFLNLKDVTSVLLPHVFDVHYLRQGCDVTAGIYLSITKLLEKLQGEFDKTSRNCWQWANKQMIIFGGVPDSGTTFTFDLSNITDQGALIIKHSPHIVRNELLVGGLHSLSVFLV